MNGPFVVGVMRMCQDIGKCHLLIANIGFPENGEMKEAAEITGPKVIGIKLVCF
jgi:hypothetical protein